MRTAPPKPAKFAQIPPTDDSESELSTMPTASRGTLLKRSEAARLLGVSTATVRRMEGSTLTPVLGPDGVHRFHEERVRELVVHRVSSVPQSPDAYDAEDAAAVFDLFDQDVQAVDVVKRTKLDPRAVVAMHRLWVSMRGGYVVTGEVARQVAALPWLNGPRPICTGEDLLAGLRQSEPSACQECTHGLSEVCAVCAKRLSAAAARDRVAKGRERAGERRVDHELGKWDNWEFPSKRKIQRESK